MTVAGVAKSLGALSDRVDALSRTMSAQFAEVNRRFEQVGQRFDQVDQRFEQVDQRFEQVDQRFEQVDQRFEQVDRRFDELREDLRAEFRAGFREFADLIHHRFTVSLEGIEARLNAAIDGVKEHGRRLDVFERANTEEHRVLQAQIDDLDSRVPRRARRRPTS